MSDIISGNVVNNGEHRSNALIAYVLMAVGLFTAIPIFIGAIWAMLKKKEAYGSLFHSHLVNATRTFWWSLLWGIIGAITTPIFIGFPIMLIAWLWVAYRLLNGLSKLLSEQAYPL